MKKMFSRILLTLSISFGFMSNVSAANIDYNVFDPEFSQSALLIGGIGEIDTFYFTNYSTSGTYHFYSTGNIDLFGVLYSDTFSTTLAQNDDGGSVFNFCVEKNLVANEAITLSVFGYDDTDNGSYTIEGVAGTCADSGFVYTYSNIPANSAAAEDSGAFGLPAILFTILGLSAVRLRRFFA